MVEVGALPQQLDITHYRGDTLAVVLHLWSDEAHTIPVNLNASTDVAAELRLRAQDPDPAVATFVCTPMEPDNNAVTLLLAADDQATLPPKLVWDMEVDWLGDRTQVTTPIRGSLALTDDVTHD